MDVEQEDARILAIGGAALDEFYAMCVESKTLWRTETCKVSNASIWSKPGKSVRLFQADAIVEAPPSVVFDVLHIKIADTREWNTSVDACTLVKQLAPNVEIMHTLTFAMYGGLVSARDFINVRVAKELEDGSGYIVGTTGIEYKNVPRGSGVTRGMNGVMGFLILRHERGTRLVWIINTDVKGWIPRSLIDAAIPAEMESYILALRKRVVAVQALE